MPIQSWRAEEKRSEIVVERKQTVHETKLDVNVRTLSENNPESWESDGADDSWHTMDDPQYDVWVASRRSQQAQKNRRFFKRSDSEHERIPPRRSKSHQQLVNVTTCNRRGAMGHWEDEGREEDDHHVATVSRAAHRTVEAEPLANSFRQVPARFAV